LSRWSCDATGSECVRDAGLYKGKQLGEKKTRLFLSLINNTEKNEKESKSGRVLQGAAG